MNKNLWLQRTFRFVPGILLGLVLLLLYKSLSISPDAPIISGAFPSFSLKDIRTPDKNVSLENFKGKVSVVHIWATWCGICVKEHNEWLEITNKWPYDLVGIVYRDDANKANRLIQEKGDPYKYLMNDISGSLGLALGLMGTPETFIVDKQGVIRFHVLGPMTVSKFEKEILPLLEKISHENA